MGKICRVAYCVVAIVAVSACVKPVIPKIPDISSPTFDDLSGKIGGLGNLKGLGGLSTCDKPETETKLTPEVRQQAVSFKEDIAMQKREMIAPDGSSRIVMAPTRHLIRRIVVMPPAFAGKVQAIEVENYRTCSKFSVVTVDQMLGLNTPDQKVVPTQNDVTGRIELEIADISVGDLLSATFVRNGVNAIEIRYLGECLVTGKDGACLSRPQLATKMIEVDTEINTFEIEGMQAPRVSP